MNFLKVIYFHVYNAYYKDGNYTNDIPYLTAYGITATSIGCLTLTLVALTNYGVLGTRLPVEVCFAVFLICLVLFFILFIYNTKYKDIYSIVKGSRWDTVTVKISVWIFIGLGFASIGLYSYIFNSK